MVEVVVDVVVGEGVGVGGSHDDGEQTLQGL